MSAVFPSAYNVFIRDHDASNKLVVDFARNPTKFAVNKYAQIVPVKKVAGYYLRMTIEECARLTNTDLSNFAWADGDERPMGFEGTESFNFLPFETKRYNYGFTFGDLTVEQATWDILAQHASIKARQAMTARTQLAITAFTTSGNYDAAHYIDVTSDVTDNTAGWAVSTTARQDIKRSLNWAADRVLLDTNSAIDIDELMLVINPTLARQMSECQEIVDHIKGSPDALAQVRGELPGSNAIFGLPEKLYGFPIVVEKTVKVTSKKGAASVSRSYILPTATPFMCARPGGLEGVAGTPSFATVQLFAQEEMSVETHKDAKNRRVTGAVVENIVAKMVAPVSGVLFYNVV
jgi:hypothetical protein